MKPNKTQVRGEHSIIVAKEVRFTRKKVVMTEIKKVNMEVSKWGKRGKQFKSFLQK